MSTYEIPQLALVALVGVSGSGKSTFAATHFGRYEVISSDVCRGLVADDENDQSASADAFELLGQIVSARLRRGRLTVVDATNVTRAAREQIVRLAREHDVLPVAIVLDVPVSEAVRRNAVRTDRAFGERVVRRHQDQLRRGLTSLGREGFRVVHHLRGVAEIDAAQLRRVPLRADRSDLTGPFDIVGDVHGCLPELLDLLGRLGYEVTRDGQGRPVDAVHPDGRTLVFVGDLVDRGPDSPGVLRLVMGAAAAGHALAVPGNHENKLVKALAGREVARSHGLAQTLEQLAACEPEFGREVAVWADALVAHLVLDGGRLVVAHAGLPERYHGRASGRVRSFALYGDTTGETDEFGLPVRYPWAQDYRGAAAVVYGHTPTPEPQWVNNTLCIDTGAVFGGRLSALRYPERELVGVDAHQVWYEPVRPLRGVEERGGDDLDLTDVLGARVVETANLGRVSVRAEQAAGALEVMSRFALPPRRLAYLPPTMAPVATSAREGLLEHPDEAFADFAAQGVREVVCEEKHMGSRAVVVLARDAAARERFGLAPHEPGVLHTRTGRAFLPPEPTAQLLARVDAAVEAAGVWDELAARWLMFDAELLPWSVKADPLLREQYAAVGAAARVAFPAAQAALEAAAARGLDVSDLAGRTAERAENAAAFTDVYRRYRWDVDGVEGVKIAPFQVLAAGGQTFEGRDHLWHLGIADRLVAADPGLFHATARLVVAVDREDSRAAGVAWWEDLTARGGEGMVVKPLAGLVRGAKGLVQPGLKVRGREYLRLIYGPDYTRPEHLTRLRERNLGRKRSLALREYALGVEALRRTAADEPLWRVHEAVFAVLALESDPVDPRL